ILFGIYQLAKENSFTWFSRRGKQNNSGSTLVFAGEETDYEAIIRKFQTDGNYRMAVRYLYLRLIHTIRGTGRIHFRDSSTNSEIVRAFGDHPQVNDFRFLASAYEHIFYGDYIPQQELFDLL